MMNPKRLGMRWCQRADDRKIAPLFCCYPPVGEAAKFPLVKGRGFGLKCTMDDVIASLEPSLGRRWFGALSLGALGVVLILAAFVQPPEIWWLKLLTPLLGLLFIWQAQWNLRVTATGLFLTRQGLFDGQGTLICALYNMREVDRGVFAFKPSNGFLVRLVEPEPKGWAPGLYWRLGKRLGIGGATHPAQNKAMAEAIEMLIMERVMGPELA